MFHLCVRATPSRPLFPRSVKLARPSRPSRSIGPGGSFRSLQDAPASAGPPRRPYSDLSMMDCWVGGHIIGACIVTAGGYISVENENNNLGPIQILINLPIVAFVGSAVGAFIAITSPLTYPIGACVLLWNHFKGKKKIRDEN